MNYLKPYNIKRVMIFLLFIGIFPISTATNYYYLLRYAIFSGAIFLAISEKNINSRKHYIAIILLCIIWFPFSYLYVENDKFLWTILDCIGIFIIYSFLMRTPEKAKILFAAKRVIDNAILRLTKHNNKNESLEKEVLEENLIDTSFLPKVKEIAMGLVGIVLTICTFFAVGIIIINLDSVPQFFRIIIFVINIVLSIVAGITFTRIIGTSKVSIFTYVIGLICCLLYMVSLL